MGLKHVAAAFLLFPFALANAALITVDTDLGSQSGVLDTQSNLVWLKVSETRDLSINQVFAETAEDGRLADFRYGTSQEVQCRLLYPNLGTGCTSGGDTKDVAAVQSFMNIFGILSGDSIVYAPIPSEQTPAVSEGFIETFITQIVIRGSAANPVEFDTQLATVSRDRPNTHWLVKDSREVPEPPTIALLAIAASGLMMLRKKTV